jgi:hypothetical protein
MGSRQRALSNGGKQKITGDATVVGHALSDALREPDVAHDAVEVDARNVKARVPTFGPGTLAPVVMTAAKVDPSSIGTVA